MKRFVSCPETLDAIIYPPQEKKQKNRKSNFAYSTEFQAMLDNLEDEDCMEESSQSGEKKRRLSFEQVKTLEKIFEADNKLDPERKVTLAQELGLQPRQVAIWFQNRRARWKTKQLERDFGVLKHDYADLQLNFDKLEKERKALIAELQELRAKLGEENTDSNQSVNEETPLLDNNVSEQSKVFLTQICTRPELASPNYEARSGENLIETQGFIGTKYGLLDRNSSEVFDEDGHQRFEHYSDSAYPSSTNCFRLLDSRSVPAKVYSPQIMKMEEESFLGTAEESCNMFFSVDQAPTIHWLY